MTSSTNTRSSSSSSSRSSSTIFDRYPILNGIGGLSHGSFFRIQDSSVLQEQERGQGGRGPTTESLAPQLYKIMIGESFIYSPNLTWLIMSVCVWCIVPYNLDIDLDLRDNTNNTNTTNVRVVQLQPQLQDVIILLDRIYINLFLALSYITFWHCALYFWGYCNRPFVSNRIYNIHKVLHNIFYTVLGIFQWTIVEGTFVSSFFESIRNNIKQQYIIESERKEKKKSQQSSKKRKFLTRYFFFSWMEFIYTSALYSNNTHPIRRNQNLTSLSLSLSLPLRYVYLSIQIRETTILYNNNNNK